MSENRRLTDLLSELEKDNAALLSSGAPSHKFSRDFDKKVLAVCRGDTKTPNHSSTRRRHLPIWAAALIVLLAASLITGCAIAVYHHFFRSIPFVGVTDKNENIQLFSTTDSFAIDDLEVETVLLLKDTNSAKLLMWATMDSWTFPSEKPVAQIKCGETVIDLFCGSLSSGGNNTKCSIYAETEPISIDHNQNMGLIYNGKEKHIEFTDVSDKGYEVAEWGIVEGITLKILPFYTNNRLLLLETEGLENAFATVSLTLYDSLGNSTKAFGSCDVENNDFFVEAENRLEGDIVKIEVNNFRINQRLEQQIFTIPLPDETAELDTPLYSSSLFADTATQIKRDGKFVYLTTVLRGVEDTQFRDFVVMYDFKGAKQVSDTLSYGEDGAYIYTYKIELPENAEELQMEATNYSCMMFATDEPVAVINITKK